MNSTTDIWFAGYLLMTGKTIEKRELLSPGRVKLFFNLDDIMWSQLKLDFVNSEFSKVKYYVEKIKDLAY